MIRATCLALFLLMLSVSTLAQTVPARSNFQGRLTLPDGTPVRDDAYRLAFRLFTAASGGTKLWEEIINPVSVRNGVFAVKIGRAHV